MEPLKAIQTALVNTQIIVEGCPGTAELSAKNV